MEQNIDPNSPSNPQQMPKKFPTWAIVVLTIAITALIVGAATYFIGRSNKQVVNNNQTNSTPTQSQNTNSNNTTQVEIFSKTIVFQDNMATTRDPNTQLFSYNLETGARKQLTDNSSKQNGSEAYSPTSHLLAYIKLVKEGRTISGDCGLGATTNNCVYEKPKYQVQIIDADSNKLAMQGDETEQQDATLSFSLDGQKLAYITNDNRLAIFDLNKHTKKYLPANQANQNTRDVVWDKDGINLYFINGSIYKLNSSDGTIAVVYQGNFSSRDNVFPSATKLKLTLDGNSLAFIFNDAFPHINLYTNPGENYLVIFDLSSKKLDKYLLESNKSRSARYLATNGLNSVNQFVITPDNSKVYFEATDETSPGINIFYLKNGNKENISDNAGFLLGFGKDANQLITRKIDDGIYSLDVSTKKLQKLTPINPVY
ncbi:MAG: hypothetical protein A2660_01880 [Candidatus Doudnabacteria bacterium RIFCSPHIGHO2_01_FULL_45_18]|uniref:DUF5050 domain-containing protein n=1 Tax=Candidatus Doudnabacteria bacterium RIFCSPHIGHO2_01_FULL_45_18 TaxID=1817823 RepID=A0A1F5NRT6_9BACT|nr:MAG: hypothetical protein A2660_01880 [Candidatus Doudnabacteria bacterium RIFCSPHIGHO2_01_FULL_45_18]